jgi:hypothetical protein
MPTDLSQPIDFNVMFDRIDAGLAHLQAGLPSPAGR